jgi:iron complex outermembrane receptor protein
LNLSACARAALACAVLAARPLAAAGEDLPRAREESGRADEEPREAGQPREKPAAFGESIVVVGARPRGSAADPTAAATVVDARRFAGEAKTVADLVATAPGVAVNGYGGLGQLATVSLRGSAASQVQVFLDGLPLATQAGGGVDLSRIPSGWIDRIEVVRGAAGALHGAGAMAGALHVSTRPALAGSWSGEATAGSFGTWQAAADAAAGGRSWAVLGAVAGAGTRGRFGYLFDPQVALDGGGTERTRDHNGAASGGALVKGFAQVGGARLDGAVQLSGGRRELPGSPFRSTPRDGQDDARLGLVARAAGSATPGLDVSASVAARDERLAVEIEPLPRSEQRDLAALASAEASWRAGPSTLTARFEGGGEQLRSGRAATRSRGTWAVALAEEVVLGDGAASVAGAARLDAEGPFRGLSAKLGGALRLAGPLSLRASGGRSLRAPSFAELYLQQGTLSANPDLVPEEVWTADAALTADGRAGFASLGGFAQLYRDVIVYEPDSFRRFKPFNAGRATVAGIEVEAASAPVGPAALSLALAYTWLRSETLRGEAAVLGRSLPHRAPHRLFARLAGGRGPVEGHLEAQWVAAQFQDTRNLLAVPSAVVAGAGVAVRLLRAPTVKLHLEVRNLLDDRSLQDGFGNPLPGRMALVTLRLTSRKDAP